MIRDGAIQNLRSRWEDQCMKIHKQRQNNHNIMISETTGGKSMLEEHNTCWRFITYKPLKRTGGRMGQVDGDGSSLGGLCEHHY